MIPASYGKHAELKEYEQDHSAAYDKPSRKPKSDVDDDPDGVSGQSPDDESEIDVNGSFLCVVRKHGAEGLMALIASQASARVVRDVRQTRPIIRAQARWLEFSDLYCRNDERARHISR